MARRGFIRFRLYPVEAELIADLLSEPRHWAPQFSPETSIVILDPPEERHARCMRLVRKFRRYAALRYRETFLIELPRDDAAWIGAMGAARRLDRLEGVLQKLSIAARGRPGRPRLTPAEAHAIAWGHVARSEREVQRVRRTLRQRDVPLEMTSLISFRRP